MFLQHVTELSNFSAFGHIFLRYVTELSKFSTFRAHIPPICYRTLQLLCFSGTYSSDMLPYSPASLLFRHIFLRYVTELSNFSAFRAHIPPICYRTFQLLCFSGTYSSDMLPYSSTFLLFGHIFLRYVTELSKFSTFRAHIPPICYRTLQIFYFSSTYSSDMLPYSPNFLLFGHIFLRYVTVLSKFSTFRAHTPPICYRTLQLLYFSGTYSSNMLPNSPNFLLFGHIFLRYVTELSKSSTFRAHIPPICYRTLQIFYFSGTYSSDMLPNSPTSLLFGHILLQYVTELPNFSAFRAHIPPICYRTLQIFYFSGTYSSNMLPNSPTSLLFGHKSFVYTRNLR
ncbi:hypothetical protein J2S25_003345 [Mesobacillus stamsii]|uniref:Uncharacterized protein n=1 Tax=Mesobacillus stamsii TaxID=225347 RepID=A0ABU0G0L7_9BACI|nr:hypothetical protein [Mesobacillus stamsii]